MPPLLYEDYSCRGHRGGVIAKLREAQGAVSSFGAQLNVSREDFFRVVRALE